MCPSTGLSWTAQSSFGQTRSAHSQRTHGQSVAVHYVDGVVSAGLAWSPSWLRKGGCVGKAWTNGAAWTKGAPGQQGQALLSDELPEVTLPLWSLRWLYDLPGLG